MLLVRAGVVYGGLDLDRVVRRNLEPGTGTHHVRSRLRQLLRRNGSPSDFAAHLVIHSRLARGGHLHYLDLVEPHRLGFKGANHVLSKGESVSR